MAAVAAWMLLFGAVIATAFTVNAFLPVRRSRWLVVPSSLFSMLAIELAAHHLVWQAIAAVMLVALGALEIAVGRVGLGLACASWLGLVALSLKGRDTRATIEAALAQLPGCVPVFSLRWWRLLVPFPLRFDRARVIRSVEYAKVDGRALRLDVHLPADRSTPRPAVVQIHGGGWVLGDRRGQGVPLLNRLSDRGFVGFNVDYRLSPKATYPDHLIDIKRAIAWVRAHAEEYAVDPRFIAVTGGSAGGHLTAMAALTAADASLQPGFESADVSVQAAVPLYGIYDLTDREHRHAPGFHELLLEPLVIKAKFAEHPERFVAASPIARVGADAPPFFVIHGARDTMAPLADARDFVAELRRISHAPVLFAEIAGAQHAFDVFVSPRSAPVIEGVAIFLEHLYGLRAKPSS